MSGQWTKAAAVDQPVTGPVTGDEGDQDRPRRAWLRERSAQIGVFVAAIVVWKAAIAVFGVPSFMLPQPEAVLASFWSNTVDGTLLEHGWITVYEILAGFVAGTVLGVVLGYAMSRSRTIERTLYPYIIAIQAVPKIAIAPLLVLWFGFGPNAKIIGAAILVFFPVLVNTMVGVTSVEPGLRELFRSERATRWQVFHQLELPHSLPAILASMKMGITYAAIGAVTVEFVGANQGLGYLAINASYTGDTPFMFAVMIALTAVGLALYGLVVLLERTFLQWHPSQSERRR